MGALNKQAVSTLQQALLELLEQEHEPDPPADESDQSSEQEAAVLFESAALVNGVEGRVLLGAETLLWGEAHASEPTVSVELATVTHVSTKRVRLSPFAHIERCIIESSQPTYFDFAEGVGFASSFVLPYWKQ